MALQALTPPPKILPPPPQDFASPPQAPQVKKTLLPVKFVAWPTFLADNVAERSKN